MTNNQTPVQLARIHTQANRYKSSSFMLPLAGLAVFFVLPLLNPSYFIIDLATKVLIFGIFACSFDVMVGYTGVLSFGHSMFFGFGAYSCAILFRTMPESPVIAIILAVLCSTILSTIIAAVMAFFSLRVVAMFFAMITLAFASFAEIIAIQFSEITGGEDGITLQLPEYFKVTQNVVGWITGQSLLYYFILLACGLMLLLMLRLTQSPFGRVLKSIRENEDRSEALGYKTFHFRLFAVVISCILASFSGILFALWLGFVSPESTLSVTITINVLIMVLIGGIGTVYGGIIGAFVLQLFESGLPQLRVLADESLPQFPMLGELTQKWHLVYGSLFVCIVIFFPFGIIGWVKLRQLKKQTA
ncbi:MAG: branched-chain amino acid ABC transporter permease [Deltaproteobacteria bacterium]|mgnify:FL=1|nr:branched-chain amino acid ABC transporter permease [Deltaproteobacteria bacterium]MBT7154305.1 branched-chain amino acid ABC transporter permease [Deltaproteobacteria bacterium]MBT7710867.1 branched-chain amino acid ABC transporter permease [Deltaproteobacteria bacterium]MBT7892660.1 branched-chain amino acid ABC transporter permease [Deltaproteobacteria bacterium]